MRADKILETTFISHRPVEVTERSTPVCFGEPFPVPTLEPKQTRSLVNQSPPVRRTTFEGFVLLTVRRCQNSKRAEVPETRLRKIGLFAATQSRWLESQQTPDTPFPGNPDSRGRSYRARASCWVSLKCAIVRIHISFSIHSWDSQAPPQFPSKTFLSSRSESLPLDVRSQ